MGKQIGGQIEWQIIEYGRLNVLERVFHILEGLQRFQSQATALNVLKTLYMRLTSYYDNGYFIETL